MALADRIIVNVDPELRRAADDLAHANKRSLSDQIRFLLCEATGRPFVKARQGRKPAPWLVVRTRRYGRGVVSRHRSQAAAQAAVREDQEVLPIDEYEAEREAAVTK